MSGLMVLGWLALLLLPFSYTYGQMKYEILNTTDGLSQGMVFDMLQDREGFIWISTKDGLNRYDGYEFKIFANDPYNDRSLNSNTIIKLFEDSNGRIWAASENSGLNIYDKGKGVFFRLENNPARPGTLSGNHIRAMEELSDGRMLVATGAGGVDVIDLPEGFFNGSAEPVITRLSLPENNMVYGIGKDQTNKIFVGDMAGNVYLLEDKQFRFTPVSGGILCNNGYLTTDSTIVINNNLYLFDGQNSTPLFDTQKMPEGNIILKPNSALWDSHHREMYFYDISRREKGQPLLWNAPLAVDKNKRILYPFIIDKSGILWCGAVGYGIRKYKETENKFKTKAKGLSIRLIIPSAADELIMVDYGYGWMKLKGDMLTKNAFAMIPDVRQIDNFIISRSKTYFLKNDNSTYFSYLPSTGKLKPLPHINATQKFGLKQPFFEDSRGWIWFPGLDGNITLFNPLTEQSDSFNINKSGSKLLCTAIKEDKDGVFWVGTEIGFVKVKLDHRHIASPEIIWFYNNPGNRNSLSYNHVSCFLDDPGQPDKYLWIATKGGGLNRLDRMTGDYFHLTAKDGLPNDVVYGILNDEEGHIWGSTNKGLFCLTTLLDKNQLTYSFRNFTKREGLQDDEFNTGAFVKLPDGSLAFGGINGLNVFDPKKVLQSSFIPNVYITNILIGNKPVFPNDKSGVLTETIELAKSITLNHLQDILTLEFSALDFSNPGQNKYRYQLVGIDPEWIQSGNRRSATYLHLPDGKYTFRVQGSNSEGIWNEKTTELSIIVLPPWWRTWWACLAYIAIIGFAVRTYFQYRINKTKIESQLILEQNEAKRVKELDTVKTQLYTNITHEFRTPLTVILGMVQQIRSAPQEHFDNGLNMIERNGKNLLNLVNEMLDLSKLEAGKMELSLVKGDVVQFLRYIVESFHSMAESQGKQMHYLASLDALFTEYDAEKMRQIISNLLSNALKFTEEKGNIYISIALSESETETKSNKLIIKVKDTGSGIPEEQILHIFDRFYQADHSHTRKAEGTGIGLALTKELVHLMLGTIEVKSPPVGARKGTEFTVTLPMRNILHEVDNLPAGDRKHAIVVPDKRPEFAVNEYKIDLKSKNQNEIILLVEDNADVVAYTASCLPEYRLAVGKDGREGFEIACELVPDLIITDVMMPFVDGFEMSKRLRQDERTSHIPIIMLTAKADMESKLEGLNHGADAYLEKPFYKEELKVRIKKLLEQRKHLQKVFSQVVGLNIATGNETIELDTAPFENLPGEISALEDAFVKKVRQEIELYLNNENFSVEQLSRNMYMSQSQVQRKLSALTGWTPNQFIRILRIQKAKELLKTSGEPIANIAAVCGFSDASYFGKVFRQECGMTPQEYRNAI